MVTLFFILGFAYAHVAFADITNRTTDDSRGDSATGLQVMYLPEVGVWQNQACTTCPIQPDISQTFSGTYTAATHIPGEPSISITMDFTGIALWVYFTLANNVTGAVTTLTAVNFTLDQGQPTSYTNIPNLSTTDFQYKQLVYQNLNLANTHHTLVMSTDQFYPDPVYVNFDYAMYTHEDTVDDPSDTPTSNVVGPMDNTITAGPATTDPAAIAPPITQTVVENHTTDTVLTDSMLNSVAPSGTTTSLGLFVSSAQTTATSPSQIASPVATTSPTTQGVKSKATFVKRAVIAGVLGGVGFILVLLFVFYYCVQWRRRASRINVAAKSLEVPTPYVDSSPSSGHLDLSSFPSINRQHKFLSKAPSSSRERESSSTLSSREQDPTSMPSSADTLSPIRRRVSFAPIDRSTMHPSDDETRSTQAQPTRVLQELHHQLINLVAELEVGEGRYDIANHLDARGGVHRPFNTEETINTAQLQEQLLLIRTQIANIEARQSTTMGVSEQALAQPPEYSS